MAEGFGRAGLSDKTDRKLLAKSFRKNKEFCKQMEINKNETDLERLFDVANEALKYAYKN